MKKDFVEVNVKGIKIDVRSEHSLYVTIGDWVVYLDDGTKERIVSQSYGHKRWSTTIKKQRKNSL